MYVLHNIFKLQRRNNKVDQGNEPTSMDCTLAKWFKNTFVQIYRSFLVNPTQLLFCAGTIYILWKLVLQLTFILCLNFV